MLHPNTGRSLDTLAERRQWGEAAYPGTFLEQAAREGGKKAHMGSRAGEQITEDELCWSEEANKGCSGEEWLGSLSCPLMKLSLQPPSYFGTLEKARFQMYHRERSCFRQQGRPVTHGAMSFLTTG